MYSLVREEMDGDFWSVNKRGAVAMIGFVIVAGKNETPLTFVLK